MRHARTCARLRTLSTDSKVPFPRNIITFDCFNPFLTFQRRCHFFQSGMCPQRTYAPPSGLPACTASLQSIIAAWSISRCRLRDVCILYVYNLLMPVFRCACAHMKKCIEWQPNHPFPPQYSELLPADISSTSTQAAMLESK